MSTKGRNPNQVLVVVNVTFKLGTPQYQYLVFADGSNGETIVVAPGDQVGWFVRVAVGIAYSTPAYELTFADSSIFGTDTISVPKGGLSGFFTVVALSSQLPKYSLAVSGISQISDPQIQVDSNGVFNITKLNPVQHNVRWTVATNTMEYQNGANPWAPFPVGGLDIAVGDNVQFFGVLSPPPPDFEILFPADLNPGKGWASPFDVEKNIFYHTELSGNTESTGNLPVGDKTDPSGTKFTFVAALTDLSAHSDSFIFNLT
jgi:hypothetical protein